MIFLFSLFFSVIENVQLAMALGSVAQKSKDVILIFTFVLIYSESPETVEVIEM